MAERTGQFEQHTAEAEQVTEHGPHQNPASRPASAYPAAYPQQNAVVFRHAPNSRYGRPYVPRQRGLYGRGGAGNYEGYRSYNQEWNYDPYSRQQFYPGTYQGNYSAPSRPSNWHRGPRPHRGPRTHHHGTSRGAHVRGQNAPQTTESTVAAAPIDASSTAPQQTELTSTNTEVTQPVSESTSNETGTEQKSVPAESEKVVTSSAKTRDHPRSAVGTPSRTVLSFANASEEEVNKLCEVERAQLKRRFRLSETLFIERDSALVDSKTENARELYTVVVSASDPDWPFDVRNVTLNVDFPVGYPREPMKITVPNEQKTVEKKQESVSDFVFPEALRRSMQQRINDFIEDAWTRMRSNDRMELQFRAFLRWFDRSLLDMFVSGLRTQKLVLSAQAAGISVAHAGKWRDKNEVQERRVPNDSEVQQAEQPVEKNLEQLQLEPVSGKLSESDSAESEDDNHSIENETKAPADGESKSMPTGSSIEIELAHFELGEQAGSLRCTAVCVELACIRCHTAVTMQLRCDSRRVNSAGGKSGASSKCIRCKTELAASYSSDIAHSSSNVIGRLTGVSNVSPNDLLVGQCRLEVQCLACGNSTALTEPKYGKNDGRCSKCFAQLRLGFDSVRFYAANAGARQLIPRFNVRRVALSGSDPSRAERLKEPLRAMGQPLPNYGTCVHYSKSFRWFRFACCGKLYPCDECHRQAEKGHEEQLANRMVCGYCSAEQPVNPRAICLHCLADLRRANSNSAFWEGGQGCRNVVRMSRSDPKKYSNQNKTESKHAVKVRDFQRGNGRAPPKDTKLRHVDNS